MTWITEHVALLIISVLMVLTSLAVGFLMGIGFMLSKEIFHYIKRIRELKKDV